MPHVAVKMYPGRDEAQKKALAEALTAALVSVLGSSPESVSVSVEDVAPAEWRARVWDPEIAARPDLLFKQPGYTPS